MPTYKNSKSQKRSQSQSKNGGRRCKQTKRKLRRGRKSRKVMKGGGIMWSTFNRVTDFQQEEIKKGMIVYFNEFMQRANTNPRVLDNLTKDDLTEMIMNHNDFQDKTKRTGDMKLKFGEYVDIDWDQGVALPKVEQFKMPE